MNRHAVIFNALVEASQNGVYPTACDLASRLDIFPREVSAVLQRFAIKGKVRRLPKTASRIQWEAVTEQTDFTLVYESTAVIVKRAVLQANSEARYPTAKELSVQVSVSYARALAALRALELKNEVTRVHDDGPCIRWKIAE